MVLKSKELEEKESNKQEIPAASALHELAVSLNLKEKMADLVEDYIKALGYPAQKTEKEGYLVLAIDDADMANVSAQAVLEQIRRFLSVPQIIILLTADFERLKIVCGAFYKNKSLDMSDEDLQKFIVDYLEKVIPSNMRIYMPELRDIREEIVIEDNQSLIDKYQLESRSEKEIILEAIARKCGIYFDGNRGRRSFWQNDSLRSLVNYFDQLMGLDDEKEHFIAWLRKDLQERIIERVESEMQKRFLRRLLKQDSDRINQCILEYIQRDLWEEDILAVRENSMGQVMYALDSLSRINAEYTEFVNCIIVLYSLIMRQASPEEKRKMIGDSLWGEWEYGLFSSAQVMRSINAFENRAELRFEVTEDIKKCIEEKNLDQVIEMLLKNHDDDINVWLLCMLYVNIKVPQSRILTFYADTEGEFFLSEEERKKDLPSSIVNKSYFKLQPQLFATKSFFKFLYMDVEEQKNLCRELLRCTIDALREKIALVMECKVPERSYTDYIEKKIKWLEEMGMQDCVSEELLQSVEILYSIGPELGREREASISETERLAERTAAVYQIVQDELKLRDEYYKEKMHIDNEFAVCIENSLQAKVLQGRADMSEVLKEKFEERFTMLFTASRNVPKFNKPGGN